MPATTIAFAQGSFVKGVRTAPPVKGTGPNQIDVTAAGGGFVVQNTRPNPIRNLLMTDTGQSTVVNILGGPKSAIRGLEAYMGGGDDTLTIGRKGVKNITGARSSKPEDGSRPTIIQMGDGNDTFRIDGQFKNGSFDAGDGNDSAVFKSGDKFGVLRTALNMGDGDDTLIFGGNVKDLTVKLGDGADTVKFNRKVRGVNLDLGNDNDIDNVIIKKNNIKGLVITGESEGDILKIGSSEYTYDATQGLWVEDDGTVRDF